MCKVVWKTEKEKFYSSVHRFLECYYKIFIFIFIYAIHVQVGNDMEKGKHIIFYNIPEFTLQTFPFHDCIKSMSVKNIFFLIPVVRHFQEYIEPEEGQLIQSPPRRGPNPLHPTASGTEEEKVLLPLGETTLTNNLGIPLVVVVTKVSDQC